MRSRNILGSSLIAIAITSLAAPAFAQAPAATSTADPAAATAAESSDGGLEEIIVTAQKRSENIQDVSLSIQAITAEGLAKAGITDVSRIELITPGLTFAFGGNDAKIAIRGANSNATFQDNSSVVGVFVDGVYKPRASQQTRAFFDIARLEVLKGPQGTLYGRNTLAGAINLYTAAPDPKALTAGVTATYARFNALRTEGYINVPLSQTFAVRLAGLYERSDGYVENEAGPRIGSKDTVSVRGSAFWQPTDDFDATLRVTNIRERGNASGLFATNGTCRTINAQGLTDAAGTILDCRNPRRGSAGERDFNPKRPLKVAKDFVNDDTLDEFNATLELNLGLGDSFNLKSITSYTDYTSELGQDGDFSRIQHQLDFFVENAESYTQELQLSTRGSSPFQATAGLYASKDKVFFGGGTLRLTRDNLAVRPTATTLDGLVRPILTATPVISPRLDLGNLTSLNAQGRQTREGQSSNTFQYIDIDTYGIFGQASYAITPEFRVVAGARYASEKKSAVNFGGTGAATTYFGEQFPLTAPRNADGFTRDKSLETNTAGKTFKKTTYRGALEYDLAEDILVYANVSTGFLSGSLNSAGAITSQQTSINYEAGIKSRFFDNKAQLNAAVYRTEYSDLATTFQIPSPSGGVETLSITGGEINVTGFEAILDIVPVDNLRLTASFSYIDAEYGTFNQLASGQTLRGLAGGTSRTAVLKGIRPPYTPKITGTFIASYDIDLGSAGKITPQVQFYYSDEYFAHGNLPFNRAGFQPSYTKTDLRVSYTTADERFGIEIFGENLENEIVNQRTQSGGDGIEQTSWGYPTNYGIRLRAKF